MHVKWHDGRASGDPYNECMSMVTREGPSSRNGCVESGKVDSWWGDPQVPDSGICYKSAQGKTV